MLCLLPALTLATLTGGAAAPAIPLSLAAELEASQPYALAPAQEEAAEGWDFSYTFFEIGATSFDVDEADETADVYYGRASLGLFKFLYVFAGYENQSIDFEDTSSDVLRLGVGGHFGVTPKLDLVGDIAWLYSDTSSDLSELDDTTDGYEVRAGARWMPFGWDRGGVELHGGAIWVDMENRIASDDTAFGFDLGAKLHFLKLFSVGAVYTMLEDDDSVGINARVSL